MNLGNHRLFQTKQDDKATRTHGGLQGVKENAKTLARRSEERKINEQHSKRQNMAIYIAFKMQ